MGSFTKSLRRIAGSIISRNQTPTATDDGRRGFLSKTAVRLGAATFALSLGNPGRASAQQQSGNDAFNVMDYGADGDGQTDDSQAFAAALDAAAEAGGGTVLVPNGKFVIASPISKRFASVAPKIILRGRGTSSQILIKSGATAFSLVGLLDLVVEHLAFVGTVGVATDAIRVLDLPAIDRAVIQHCQFYGLSSEHSEGAIVAASAGTKLNIEHCAFLGSASKFNGVVYADGWGGFKITDSAFLDYGLLDGTLHSKTPSTVTLGWIRVRTPSGDFHAQQDQGELFIRNVRMDEGSILGLIVDPPETSPRIGHVFISGLRVNGNGLANSKGAHVSRTDNVFIERSWVGYNNHDTPHNAFQFFDAGDVVLDAVRCEEGFTSIYADAATSSLTVKNSIYKAINSDAPSTVVIKNGKQVSPPATLEGKAALESIIVGTGFGSITPPDAGLAVQGRSALGTATANSTVQVGGSIGFKTRVVTNSTLLTDNDFLLIVAPRNTNIVVTLPDPRLIAGRVYVIKRNGYGTGTVTIAQTGLGVEIDNTQTNYQMGSVYNASVMLITNGAHWYIISKSQ
jgi:hypothetical protein